jgi:hypothetical protein
MKCVACQKELTKKDLLFTEDKEAVCVNPFTCTDEHPNSVKNIIARGNAVRLFNESELEDNTFEKLNVSDEMKAKIMKVSTKPQSIRLSKIPIAHYVVAKMEENPELNSISEVVRHCVEIAMTVEPLTGNIPTRPNRHEIREAVLAKAQAIESGTSGLTGIVIPDIPKSLNVDWNDIDKQIAADKATEDLTKTVIPNPDEEEDEF